MKLPETIGGCEQMLAMIEPELKKLQTLRTKLWDRLSKLREGSPRTPARAASVQGEKSPKG